MGTKKEIQYLLQVALPFCVLAYLKSLYFLTPVLLIILSLPLARARQFLIKNWQRLGHLLSKVVSPVVLSAIYYAALTPLALVRRCFGSDELLLKRPEKSTLQVSSHRASVEQFDDLW